MEYAKYINSTTIERPTDAEFAGILNWRHHDAILRAHGYLPLVGEPEDRPGFEAVPVEFAPEEECIRVLRWDYRAIPPEPEPDTTERDDAEKAIVGRIAQLAVKYDALSDLAELELTIPNLLQLAADKEVTDADLQAVKSDVAILVLDLMAKEGGDWASCWEGMKSRFQQWLEELLSSQG